MKTNKSRRVLLLGGNRFLGPRLSGLLLSKGYDVATFNRSGNPDPHIKHFSGNRSSLSDLGRAFSWSPDVIVDTSLYNPLQAVRLAEVMADRAIRYVAVSTASIYSHRSNPPWSEDAPLEPHAGWGHYARQKMHAENALRETVGCNVELVILRPVYFLGPGNPIERCTYFFSRAARNAHILVPGNGEAPIQFVDIDHLTTLLATIIPSDCTGTFNVASTEPIEVECFIRMCVKFVGKSATLVNCHADAEVYDESLWPFPNLPLWVSINRLENVTGHSALKIDEIVKREFDWWSALPEAQRRYSQSRGESAHLAQFMTSKG